MKNYWIETRWQLLKDDADSLNAEIEQLGSLGSYEKMGLLPDDEERRTASEVLAYFPDTVDVDAIIKKLSFLETPTIKLTHVERIPQAEWATEWRKYFKPFFLTSDIVIRPSWEEYKITGAEKVVTLDPGMAFGTGQHDTTRFCAEFLCELKARHPGLGSVLDLGCGSGILAIIAKKIGFAPVIGIDIDAVAIETANENLARNPDVGEIIFRHSDGGLNGLVLKTCDVVVSNIIAETLCELKNDLLSLVGQNGFLILSGILPQREALVKETFRDLQLVGEKKSSDWHAYIYRRQ